MTEGSLSYFVQDFSRGFLGLFNKNSNLFATADDFQTDSLINQSDFTLEGRAFYAYGAGSGNGTDYYRFENTEKSGTYLFPEGAERDSILRNFSSFDDRGSVWAVER